MFMRKIVRSALALCAVLLIVPSASARMKVDEQGLDQISSVALVGYSFFRNVEMEPASPFKLKREFIELTPEDPEYQMMELAHARIIEVLRGKKDFELLPQEEVFENESYQSLSEDPAKRLAMNWYFPGDFQDLTKNKDKAITLAQDLGVDAVLWIHVRHGGSSTTSNTLGAFGKKKEFVRLKGEVTLFDRSGNKLISGSVRSKKLMKSSSRSIGAVGEYDSGIEIQTAKSVTQADDLWFPLLDSYLAALDKSLAE
jgi:hypothetical protein